MSNIGFQQDFNNYLWQYDLQVEQNIASKWKIYGVERFRSSLLKVESEADKWKDDQTFNVNLEYRVFPKLSVFTSGSYVIFMDQQSGYQSDIRTGAGNVGIKYAPQSSLSGKAQFGPKWDTRYGLQDKGMYYAVDIHADEFDLEEYQNKFDVTLSQDQFRIRRNRNFNVNYAVSRQFQYGTTDSLRIFVGNQRRDNYLSSLGDIESYRDNVKGFDNFLTYGTNSWMSFRINSRALFKNVQVIHENGPSSQRQRTRNDQLVGNSLTTLFQLGRLQGLVTLLYESQQQKYDIAEEQLSSPFSRRTAFITPDNSSSTLALTSRLVGHFSVLDSLGGYFSISKFSYDTPDTNNFDDRDELRINSSIVGQRRFGPYLKLKVLASVNLYHMVYIFGERSADNNWNRIFRLRTNVDYQPIQAVRLKQSFEVLSNYIDYDFEQPSVTVRSFVFRKFAADDSLQIRLTSRTSLDVDYRLQLEEHGRLFWERWSEQVLVTRNSHWLRLSWRYSVTPNIWFAPGFTLYRRDEWRHLTDPFGIAYKEKSNEFVSRGPVLRWLYSPSRRTHLEFSAIRLAVDSPNQQRYYINNIDVQLQWNF